MIEVIVKAEEAFKNGQSQEALTLLARVLSLEPSNIRALMGLGVMCHSLGNYVRAREAFEKILVLDRNHHEARKSLIQSLLAESLWLEAKPHLEFLLAVNQNDSQLWATMARLENSLGNTGAAMAHAQKSLTINPDQPELATFLERPYSSAPVKERPSRLVFLIAPGNENRINYLLDGLSRKLDFTRVVNLNIASYHEAISRNEIIWLEGTGDLQNHLTRDKSLLSGRRLMIHLTTDDLVNYSFGQLSFESVEDLIFDDFFSRDLFLSRHPAIKAGCRLHVVPTPVDLERFAFVPQRGHQKIVALGDLGFQADPLLLLQSFMFLLKRHPGISLNLGGICRGLAYEIALPHFVRENKLEASVNFHGPIAELKAFLSAGDFIFSTGLLAGQTGVLEAIHLGLRPLIYNSPGAATLYPPQYLWKNLEDLDRLFTDGPDPAEGRDFVATGHSLEQTVNICQKIIQDRTADPNVLDR